MDIVRVKTAWMKFKNQVENDGDNRKEVFNFLTELQLELAAIRTEIAKKLAKEIK